MTNIEIDTPDVAAGSGSTCVVYQDSALYVMMGQFGGRQAASIEYKHHGYSIIVNGGPALYAECQKIRKSIEEVRATGYLNLFFSTLGLCMNRDNLTDIMKKISEVYEDGRRQGVRDAKQELRMWIHGE